MKTYFYNKTVLITGATSGIGESIAYNLANKGASLILTGRNEDKLKKVKCKCENIYEKSKHKNSDNEEKIIEKIRTYKCDMSNLDSINSFVNFIKKGDFPDIFILNAGISQRSLSLDTDIDVDRKLMDVNYFSGVYFIKCFKEELKKAKLTQIAVTTSISGLFGFPLRSAYCASKHALHGFYESLDLENDNIKVTFLVPGRINTPISMSAILNDGTKYNKMDSGQAHGMNVDKCASIAVRAIRKRKHIKLIGNIELIMAYFHKYCPWLFWILAKKVSAK